MSDLELRSFHSFLEGIIEDSFQSGRFSVEKTIQTILANHRDRVVNIQSYVNELGLRALIRNNCRAKRRITNSDPDMFGHYRISKRISVPYRDEKGKLRWDKKRRSDLSFNDLDEILARWNDRPTRRSKERQDFDEIEKRTKPYRNKARSVGEALEMAFKEGR